MTWQMTEREDKCLRLIETKDWRRIITEKIWESLSECLWINPEDIDIEFTALFSPAERDNIAIKRGHIMSLRDIMALYMR